MKRTPSRVAYVAAATISSLLALVLTEPALAHVDVRPRLVELGVATELRVELRFDPVRLEVEGEGVTVLASSLQGAAGSETVWNVRVRVSRAVSPGELSLILRAVFADGRSVEVDAAITVVPPPEEASGAFPWLAVAAGVAVALAVAVATLVLARRRHRSAC